MSENKSTFRKALLMTSVIYGAFTTVFVAVPIILKRVRNNARR